jgi:hypothetical protein
MYTHTLRYSVFSRHLQYIVHNNGCLEGTAFSSLALILVMTNLRRPIHVWKTYHHEIISHTSRFVCIYGLLTALSLLQECMESNGRSSVQKEAVVAIFKIPEFSWKECEKQPKICQVSRSPKRAKYGLPNY